MTERPKLGSYRDLRVWQLGMNLVESIYGLSKTFPNHEQYGLSSQIQRAAVSIPSNIAEGYTRTHRKEYLYHLSIAQASLAELETQLEIALRLSYADKASYEHIRLLSSSLGRQLYALRTALSKSP